MEEPNAKKPLGRNLSQIDVFAMAIGVMVGWGAFVMPGTTFLPIAGPAGSVLALAIGALVMLVIGANFAYLMRRSVFTGGVYSYTKEAFGRDHAFLSSWFLCLSYLTIVFLNGTALFIVVRTMMNGATVTGVHYTIAGNDVYLSEVLVSVAAFAVVGLLFVKAKPFPRKLFSALAIVLAVGVLIVAAVCVPRALASGAFRDFGYRGFNRGYAVFTLVILAPWAYVGFETVSFDIARFRFSGRNIRRVLFAAIIACGLFYGIMPVVAVSFVPDGYGSWMAYVADLDNLNGVASVPTFNAARACMGSAGLVIMTISALAAIFTGIIGAYRAALRLLTTMAEDHILSEKFARTEYGIVFIMVISVLLSMLGRNTLDWFVDLTAFGAIIGFGYTSAAAWKVGRMEGNRRAALCGIAGTVISAAFAVVQLVPRMTALEAMGSEAFLLLALWCLLGFIFYLRTVNETTLAEFTGMSTSGVALFALLVYSALMWIAKRLVASGNAAVRDIVVRGGIVLMLIVFVGLAVMIYIQNLIRKKHEVIEREKIRAVESSLAKSQFLFNMSHDIRTPMNAIIGYTALASKENDPAVLHEYLGKIDSSSHHLLTLINDILEMSRIESGAFELEFVPTDLPALFGEIHDLFAEQMKQKRLDFTTHSSQVQNRYAWCDRKNLTRVLLNVVSNAYKFTPEGGTISMSLWEVSGDDGYGSYEIRIRDSGIGMSQAFVDKMFTAFERERTSTDSGVEGTGLGLSITKSIVDLMGGTIEVLTSPGNGTELVLRVRLKLADEGDMAREEAAEPTREDREVEVDFSRMRLLLVEDNLINMEIASMILTRMGFTVETAENGQIAVDRVAASSPGHYDLVLMDIQMPVMDGYTATRTIRALDDPALAGIPIVAMTANAFAEDVQAAMDAGMQAHIAKPVDIAVLHRTLQEVLGQRQTPETRSRIL